MQSNIINKITKAFLVFGFAISLGSIASFIAMNLINEKEISIQLSYWQRTFVNLIMNFVTIPGIWIFLVSNILLFIREGYKIGKINIVFLILAIIIFINGQFIIAPVAENVTGLAIKQFSSNIIFSDYLRQKTIEDFFGGINLILFLSYLVLYIKKRL